MKVTGIIAEYNPLHSGHKFHIDTARSQTGADYIIVVMSGNHVQRGVPAIVSKYERTREALLAGADLVLELPVYYSTASLQHFSEGAVSLLDKLNVVNCLSFGSECGELGRLIAASDTVDRIMHENKTEFKHNLSSGLSYASAISKMAGQDKDMLSLLECPNNSLGIGYITAGKKLNADYTYHTVARYISAYNDESTGALSATSARSSILSGNNEALATQLPTDIYTSLLDHLNTFSPITEDDYSMLLFYKLNSILGTSNDIASLTRYLDVSESLANKIARHYKHADSYSLLCQKTKSRDLLYSRISRTLLHILLDITSKNMNEYIDNGYNYYARILGFRKSQSTLLHELKKVSSIPLITKLKDAEKTIIDFYNENKPNYSAHSELALRMLAEDINSSEIYNKAVCTKSRQPFKSEYESQLIIL